MARTGTGSTGSSGSTGSGSTGSGALLGRRNARLDSFLKRNTERAVYERIRASEPCVVRSAAVDRVYMHAVLSDERVYLTEYPPRALTAAVHFGRVRDIELVNDLPEFLSMKDRERCQHVRIVHLAETPAGEKSRDWLSKEKGAELRLPPVAPPSRRTSHCPATTPNAEGLPADSLLERHPLAKPGRSASCPNPETLGLPRVPHPPAFAPPFSSPPSPSQPSPRSLRAGQVPRRIGSVLSRLLRRDGDNRGEGKEAELHLYAVSHTSRLYLHLLSSWNSFIIRSTLLLDPRYRRRCSASISWERTAQLFDQLRSELLQDGVGVETLYLLLQELQAAARHSLALRRLFWRSGELCVFLVQTLEDLQGGESPGGVHAADRLLLSTLVVQTLAVMFRETEVEAARINLLSAKKGALASRLLLASVCDPKLRTSSGGGSLLDAELQVLLDEYLDATCWLLSELLLLGHETSRCSPADERHRLTVGWILRVLQPHPHLLAFVGHQARQVVLVLSEPPDSALSPTRAVLLFQRCRLLLACLRHDTQLAEHLRSHFSEDFRYCVTPSRAEEKLPPHFPIARPTLRLVDCLLTAMLRT